MNMTTFTPRFVRERDLAALANMWHLSATACANVNTNERRHARLTWTARQFVLEHDDELSELMVYKDLTAMLEHG